MPVKSWEAIAIFDIDGVVRDVSQSYRRAIADTVETFTQQAFRPSVKDIDALKSEGIWNNDWDASQELIYRFFEAQGRSRDTVNLDYETLVAFFQSRYRGPDPNHWTGYICDEPLLMSIAYLEQLSQSQVGWGFFSGATRGSALYVLEKRMGLDAPTLIAMEDAPGKPDPTGLLMAVTQIEAAMRSPHATPCPVLYVGDTTADMQTVQHVRQQSSERQWVGVGVLPPHAQLSEDYAVAYAERLRDAGAEMVLPNVTDLTPEQIATLLK